MAEVGRWNGHVFEVSPGVIRSFSDLSVSGGCEVDEKTEGKQTYATRKAGRAADVQMTVSLNAVLGCDVRAEALAFAEEARAGASGYLYIGTAKLLAAKVMLVSASVDKVEIAPGGQWMSASVALTLKQADKTGASAQTGAGGSKKQSASGAAGGYADGSGMRNAGYLADKYKLISTDIRKGLIEYGPRGSAAQADANSVIMSAKRASLAFPKVIVRERAK